MKQKIFAATKIAITALFFFYIFRKTDLDQFVMTLRNARIDILISGFLILWIGHYICTYRWRMLMRPLMPIPSLNNLFGIYCIGLFFNMIFPTVIGGDVVKMYYAGKPSKKYAQSFAAAFLDRDAGMFAMMIIACVAVLVYPVAVPGIPVSIIIWSVFIAFVLGNIAIFVPRVHRLMTDILQRLNLSKIATKVDMISSAFQIMGKHKSVLLWSLVISFANQLLVIAVIWITAWALRLDISLSYFLIFVPVITLISMMPISLNGMGLREYSYKSLFGAIGVLPASCVALGLISSIVLILTSLPGGIVYIFFRSRADMQQLSEFETEFS
jgi:glycosyltransferase 2 family protein